MSALLILFLFILLLLLIEYPFFLKTKQGLTVLAYTNIGAPPANCTRKELWISGKNFKRQLSGLLKKNRPFIKARDLQSKQMPPQAILITFDCGYESFYQNAWPILNELKVPCLVFLSVAGIDGYNYWHNTEEGPWQNILTWEQIKELKKTDLIEFGSRGLTGRDLGALDKEAMENEAADSAARLANFLKIKPDYFCYTNPENADNAAVAALVTSIYKLQFTDTLKINSLPLESTLISRVPVYAGDNAFTFRLKTTGKL